MIWKVIAQSVIGSSHIQSGKSCEDAVQFKAANYGSDDEILIGFVSDGAGSANFAAIASELAVNKGIAIIDEWLSKKIELDEDRLLRLAETIYDSLLDLSLQHNAVINEFSCTLLGFIILPWRACFIQIGDGAIIRNSGGTDFTHLWWPHNGEYQNTTAFLVDHADLRNLKIKILEERIVEVAVFTDGLQMLALNNETETVHQPFFRDLFKWLRKASDEEHINILNNKLKDYLGGASINSRTDDDKTLLLATRFRYDSPVI